MKILCFGNSFSDDATRYLHQIAHADAQELTISNLCIGGCSLYRHYRNLCTGDRAYTYYFNGQATPVKISIPEALCMDEWDIVTLQQASPSSFCWDSYEPFLEKLAQKVRELAPKAKLLIHETWFYAKDGRLFPRVPFETSEEMFAAVHETYQKAAEAIHADGVIPAGTALFRLWQQKDSVGLESVHRDGHHASFGAGRYMLALAWYVYLTGRKTADNTFRDFDEPVTEEQAALCRKIADELTENR